jgi:hypothetical protein
MVRKTIEIKDLEAGQEYNIQLRAIGDNDSFIASNWSTRLTFTTEQDLVGPIAPAIIDMSVSGSSFKAVWDAPTLNDDGSPVADLKDYKVVVEDVAGAQEVIYYTAAQQFTFSDQDNESAFGTLTSGVLDVPDFLAKNIKFTLYSRDYAHNESTTPSFSSAINAGPDAPVLVDQTDGTPLAAQVNWNTPAGNDILVYRLRRRDPDTVSPNWDKDVVVSNTQYVDTGLSRGVYTFMVEAYDKFGNVSGPSNEVTSDVVGFWEAEQALPDAPTVSSVASSFDIDTQASDITFDVTGPATADGGLELDYDYHSHYEVRWSTNAAGPFQYQTIEQGDNTQTHSVSIQGLKPSTLYYYGVKSVSQYGRSGVYETGSTTTDVDVIAPDAPAGLVAQGSLRNITVSWTPNSEPDLAYYTLYTRATTGLTSGTGTKIYQGNGSGFAHIVEDNETWYYVATATDNSGNVSSDSTEVDATSTVQGGGSGADTDPPADVTGVSVNAVTYYHGSSERSYADVSWTASTDDSIIAGYIVSYSVDSETTWFDQSSGPEELTYRVPDLEPGVQVYVRLKAIDGSGKVSVNWSVTQSDTPTNTDGAIQEEVSITVGGAIQSDNFDNTASSETGFRLDPDSLEIYGSVTHPVSLIIGNGGSGLNISSVTDSLWFGGTTGALAGLSVNASGQLRVGAAAGSPIYINGASGNMYGGASDFAGTGADWSLLGNGEATFSKVSITADDLADATQVLNVSNNFIVTKTDAANATVDLAGIMNVTGSVNVNSGSITINGGDLNVTNGDIQSADGYVPGSGIGFRLEGATAKLYADSAELDSLSVTGASDFGGTMTASGTMASSTQTGSAGWTITEVGTATFKNVSIDGGTLDIGAGFSVTNTGVLTATGAQVTGAIQAESGYLEDLSIQGTLAIEPLGIIRATGSAGRLEIDDSGLKLYDAITGGNLTVSLDSDTGGALFTGDIVGASTIQIGSGQSVFKADSSGIYLGDEVFANAEFRVTPAGVMTATGGNFSGDITGGTIQIGSGSSVFKADAEGIYLGDESFALANFSVSPEGELSAFGGSFNGDVEVESGFVYGLLAIGDGGRLEISGAANSYKVKFGDNAYGIDYFGLDMEDDKTSYNYWLRETATDRTLFSIGDSLNGIRFDSTAANELTIEGTLYSTAQLIGGSILIGSGNNVFIADNAGIYLGSVNFNSAPFRVSPQGYLTATSGTFSGNITGSAITGSSIRTESYYTSVYSGGTGNVWFGTEFSTEGILEFEVGTNSNTTTSVGSIFATTPDSQGINGQSDGYSLRIQTSDIKDRDTFNGRYVGGSMIELCDTTGIYMSVQTPYQYNTEISLFQHGGVEVWAGGSIQLMVRNPNFSAPFGATISMLTNGNISVDTEGGILTLRGNGTNIYGYTTVNNNINITGSITCNSSISGTSLSISGNISATGSISANSTVSGGGLYTSGYVKAGFGSTSFPGYSFASDTNTGMTRTASDTLEFVVGGSRNLYSQSGIFTGIGNGTKILGNSSNRWGQIYSSSSTISTSDPRSKTNIQSLSNVAALDFIRRLDPITYNNVNGGVRPHHGLDADQVGMVLDDLNIDHAAYIDPSQASEDDILRDIGVEVGDIETATAQELADARVKVLDAYKGMRYEEIIADLIGAVQRLAELTPTAPVAPIKPVPPARL